MSSQLINRSPDLKRLRDEGFELEVKSNYLLVKHVPYLNSKKEVAFGTLVSTLSLVGDATTTPDDHQAHFCGEAPCNADGTPIAKIINQSVTRDLANALTINHSFSAKPKTTSSRYSDYYDKMTTYVAILGGPAQVQDSTATAKTFAVVEAEGDDSPFQYLDTATSRAGIGALADKFNGSRIAIVGLGGTGSFVLDLVAKTTVREIHLFDGDEFFQHNAFRSPGAPSLDALRKQSKKVSYYQELYSKLRRNLFAHDAYIDSTNIERLKNMDFVFICIDTGPSKKLLVEKLEEFGISFVDAGMGVFWAGDALGGVLRVTTSTPKHRGHVREKGRVSFAEADQGNLYNQNIQIADLNALNAVLAVIKWKKLMGFYLDLESENFSTYTIDGNALTNEDRNEA